MKKSHSTPEQNDTHLPGATPVGDVVAETSPEAPLETALAERDAHYSRWMRAEADLENYRKRAQREAEETRRYAVLSLVRDLLPGIDNLQRAIAAAANAGEAGELVEGVKLVLKQFEDVLAAHSIQPIAAVGQPFDPNLHAAVQQVPSPEHPSMTVLEELERGYRLHDRVVRPSQVIVSRNSENPEDGNSAK